MKQHDSSFVRSVGYDWDAGTLRLRLGKRQYEFFDIPEEVYQHLLRGESLGKKFNELVRNKYPFKEVLS